MTSPGQPLTIGQGALVVAAAGVIVGAVLVWGPRRWRPPRVHQEGFRWMCPIETRVSSLGVRNPIAAAGWGKSRREAIDDAIRISSYMHMAGSQTAIREDMCAKVDPADPFGG